MDVLHGAEPARLRPTGFAGQPSPLRDTAPVETSVHEGWLASRSRAARILSSKWTYFIEQNPPVFALRASPGSLRRCAIPRPWKLRFMKAGSPAVAAQHGSFRVNGRTSSSRTRPSSPYGLRRAAFAAARYRARGNF